MSLSADRLIAACDDLGTDAGISIRTQLEPLEGRGAPVKPATYAGSIFQRDRRWRSPEDDAPKEAIIIDNIPSQANRLEHALKISRPATGLPEIVLDLSGVGSLPAHLPTQISSFDLPHRNADAYLRDAQLDGVSFMRTAIGQAIFAATPQSPSALFEWMPQALLYGFWQSHLGKKAAQTKLARSVVSEIVGYEPATGQESIRINAMKGDPLNLSIADAVQFDAENTEGWLLTEDAKKKTGGEKLSEIGHGQVINSENEGALAGVSFASIEQSSTVSFAGLRRIWSGSAEANATGRALLVSIHLAAHAVAFGRSFSLRSGSELRPVSTAWTWLGEQSDEAVDALTQEAAFALVKECARRANAAGLPVGDAWSANPLVLLPQDKLAKVIRKSYPLGEDL